jgi:hypothetical protein
MKLKLGKQGLLLGGVFLAVFLLVVAALEGYFGAWHGGKRARAWTRELFSDQPASREAAEKALTEMGSAAIPELIRLLETRDSALRRQLTQWTTRGPRPVRRLIRVRLGNSDSAIVREKGAQLLGKLGPRAKAAVPELLRALGDPDMTVATTAAGALGRIGEPAVAGLIAATTSTNQITRHMAVFALGEIGHPARESIPALISRLEDSYLFVQSSASWSLAQMGSNAVTPLIEATTREDPRAWMAAVRVLTNQPSLLRLVIPELEVMAGATDAEQRRKAGIAVNRLNLRNRRLVEPEVQ